MGWALLQSVLVPIGASVVIAVAPFRARAFAGWTVVAAMAYTTAVLGAVAVRLFETGSLVERIALGPEVSLNLLADGLSLPVALVVNMVCLALSCYSIHYVDHRVEALYPDADDRTRDRYVRRFFLLYLLFPAGFMGVVFSTNLMAVYFFMELLTILPLYFIMAQFGYSDYMARYRVAMLCLYWGVAGATLFLIGILVGYDRVGSLEIAALPRLAGHPQAFWAALLVLLGLGTKLAVVPFHVWMPWVHAEHPTCIAGLLAIYANIAAYVAVRVLILPLGGALQAFSLPVMALAMVTMTYGALLTMAQTDVKRFCACSTISQIAYSVFGIAAMNGLGVQGGIFYFLSHILGKAVLFSAGGILVYTLGVRDMRQMGGLGRRMPVTAALWFSAALILSALPPTSGFAAKWMFFSGAFRRVFDQPVGLAVAVAAVMATLLTLVYTFGAGMRIFFGEEKPGRAGAKIQDPPLSMSVPLLLLVGVSLLLGVYPDPLLSLLESAVP